jgi:hypothetical protein
MKKPTLPFRPLAALPALGLVAIAIVVFLYNMRFPYGHREAFLRSVDRALQNYANDHGGAFPNDPEPSFALAKLYPEYSNSGIELAGLSGNIQLVTNALNKGLPISNLTSWIYVPGLRETDNQDLAILWEEKQGLSQTGHRGLRKTRPVLLVGEAVTNVAEKDWNTFLQFQQELRKSRVYGQ